VEGDSTGQYVRCSIDGLVDEHYVLANENRDDKHRGSAKAAGMPLSCERIGIDPSRDVDRP
jgi:hypothetical protein